MAVDIPKRIGYAGGNLKDLARVLHDLDTAITGNMTLPGITATATEINVLDGIAPTLTAAELSKLDGAGAVVASGTAVANIADAKVDYTTGDLSDEAEIIAAINTLNGKINALIAAVEAFGIAASA